MKSKYEEDVHNVPNKPEVHKLEIRRLGEGVFHRCQ